MPKGKDLVILLLSVAVAFLLGYIFAGQNSKSGNLVYADGAANGVIVATGAVDDKRDRLYIVDTDKKVICVYDNIQGKFRLVGIRSYRFDIEFNDSANDKVIEDARTGADFEYMQKKFKESGGK